jgi:hypothetical protein
MEKNHVDKNAHSQIRTSQISLGLAATALVVTLVMSGFYISDSITGKSNFRNAIATLGFCPQLEQIDSNQASDSALKGEQGEPGVKGDTGATGATGATGRTGPAGPCTNILDLELVNGNIVPAIDNVFSIGSEKLRWKDLQLGPGTLYIEDAITGKQVGVTVNEGSFLIDGADSLRLGNIRLTATGLESIISSQDITIGNLGDSGFVVLARGLKFPDGSIQKTAAVPGAVGPAGEPGPIGPAGAKGDTGDLGSYSEYSACLEGKDGSLIGQIEFGTCAENKKSGTDIKLLMRIP